MVFGPVNRLVSNPLSLFIRQTQWLMKVLLIPACCSSLTAWHSVSILPSADEWIIAIIKTDRNAPVPAILRCMSRQTSHDKRRRSTLSDFESPVPRRMPLGRRLTHERNSCSIVEGNDYRRYFTDPSGADGLSFLGKTKYLGSSR